MLNFSLVMVKKDVLCRVYVPKLCLINQSPLGRKKTGVVTVLFRIYATHVQGYGFFFLWWLSFNKHAGGGHQEDMTVCWPSIWTQAIRGCSPLPCSWNTLCILSTVSTGVILRTQPWVRDVLSRPSGWYMWLTFLRIWWAGAEIYLLSLWPPDKPHTFRSLAC